jgi:hypothetical protein
MLHNSRSADDIFIELKEKWFLNLQAQRSKEFSVKTFLSYFAERKDAYVLYMLHNSQLVNDIFIKFERKAVFQFKVSQR